MENYPDILDWNSKIIAVRTRPPTKSKVAKPYKCHACGTLRTNDGTRCACGCPDWTQEEYDAWKSKHGG